MDRLLQLCGRFYAPKYGEFEPEHIEVKLPAPTHYKKLVRDKAYKDLDLRQLTARRIAYKTITTGTCLGHDNFQQRLYYEDNTIKADWLDRFLKRYR